MSESTETNSAPATAQEAWDRAMAAMTDEQRVEYRRQLARAVSAGMPTPTPPGYRAPATPSAPQVSEDDIAAQIRKAQEAGDWDLSFKLKSQLTSQRNFKKAAHHGWEG